MANKLYPPQIEGSLPAFYLNYDPTNSVVLSANITVPFSMNAAVSINEVKAFVLRLRTTSSGSYLFAPIYSENYNLGKNTVTFGLTQSQAQSLNEGQYYKIQIAYCGSAYLNGAGALIGEDIGYFSTVGIIKCTSKPKVYINNLTSNNVNFFTNDFIGVYDQSDCLDQTEKVYSYEFNVYDDNDEIYFSTGDKIHQTSYDTDYNFSIDKVSINDFVSSGVTYSIQYKVKTMNGLELITPKYKITNENLASPNKNIKILPESNEDNGYITVKFIGDLDLNKSWYYVLNDDILQSEKNPETGEYIEDLLGHTIKNVAHYIENYKEKITFLKRNSLFKSYNNNNNFIYKWDKNIPDKKTKKNINGEIRFIDTDILSITPEEEIENLPYYQLISKGRDLIKNLSYKYIKDEYLEVNLKENYIKLENGTKLYLIANVPFEAYYYGSYILSRASDEDNYTTWFIIDRFRLDDQPPSSYSVKDITVEHGRNYKYSLQQTNIWGLVSSRLYSDIVYANFEDMYLYDGKKVLKIRYNPKVESFKTTVLEQKTDTIGGRFPYITRNGATWYKQFPIGGLIAQELDTDELFINRNWGEVHRHSTIVDQNNDMPKNALRDYRMFSNENILLEREFKIAVLDWLNDGNAKLFKSPYEGNYIVRLMQNNLTPIKELGRMLHNFTSQAYEIAECNYENLVKYGFIDALPPSDYTGLWKTYQLNDPSLKDNNGDIVIKFDVGLNTFTIQDMMPGDIIYLLFEDNAEWEPIMIGITGSYSYINSDRIITKLKIHPTSEISQTSDRNVTGILNCYYQGVRITAFDSIINQQLITIPSQQFIGVNPWLYSTKKQDWYQRNNYDTYVFLLTDLEHEELQNYNIRDFLSKANLTNDGKNFKINDEFIKIIQTFEPGEILERIDATLNCGEAYKIKLLNIEQAKFKLRDIIPVYVINNNYEADEYLNPSLSVYGERTSLDGNNTTINYQMVSVSPYGYPHRIEELTEFEMIDPFCIFEVFEMDPVLHSWRPISLIKKKTPYYDPFYKTWLTEYNPTFKINYHWKKLAFLTPGCDLPEKRAIAIQNRANNLPYHEEDIYDYEIQIDENYNTYYYINNIGAKIYLETPEHFDLYFKEKGQYYTYGTQSGVLSKEDPRPQIFYIKEYESEVSLSTIKEKAYTNLKDINSILIGTGVIAELTFQLKVIDYYTEVYDSDVKAAKDEYLNKKNFYSNLMKQYSILSTSDYYRTKYSALYNAYGKLLNGTNKTYLVAEDKSILNGLLKNNYELEQLNLLTLYNVILIDESLNLSLLNKLMQYKNKYINEYQFGFNKLQVYTYKENEDIYYYVLNQDDIQSIQINENNIEGSLICYQKDNVTGNEIYYNIDKMSILNLYLTKNPQIIIVPDDLFIKYSNNYTSDNINNLVYKKAELTNNNLQILELNNLDSPVIIKTWMLLNDTQKEDLEKASNFISIEPINYLNEQTTPETFFEEKELIKLSNTNEEIEGVAKKLSNLQEEITNLNNDIIQLNEIITSERSQYIQFYDALNNVLNNYNERVYQNWAYNEICKLLENQSQSQIENYFDQQNETLADALQIRQNKISNRIYACKNLYNNIIDAIPKIERYKQMQIDATDKNSQLQTYLREQLIEKYGQIIICTLALREGIISIKDFLQNDTANTEQFKNDFKEIINDYNRIYDKVADPITNKIYQEYFGEDNSKGLRAYLISIRDKCLFLRDYEIQLLDNSTTYTNPATYAEISNYFDDIEFIQNKFSDPDNTEFNSNNNFADIEFEFTFDNISYTLLKLSYPYDNDQEWKSFKEEIYNNNITNPINDDNLNKQILYYNKNQIKEFNNKKEIDTYFYRTSLELNANSEADSQWFTTFIFYPLSSQKDLNIDSKTATYNSNYEYFKILPEKQQIAVLQISTQLSNIILNYFNNQYKPVYDDGAKLKQHIQDNYLGAEKPGDPVELDTIRNDFINGNSTGPASSLVNAYNNFINKILQVESKLIKENWEPHPSEPNIKLIFYNNNDYTTRDWFKVNNNLPQSLMYTTESMEVLGNVIEDENSNEIIITPGYFLTYLNKLAQEELKMKQEILKQALYLLNLYEQQYNNYNDKYNTYHKSYLEYETIFNSYIGTEELNYYKNKTKTIADYRYEVKKAWWNFLNLLDDKYTKEKERGMYI